MLIFLLLTLHTCWSSCYWLYTHVDLLATDSTHMLIFLLLTWLLCDSAFQLYILSEVRLLNFLRLFCTTKYYFDRNDVRTTSIQYYSVLQSTTPVLLRTTKYYSVLQSTTPVLLLTTKYYSVLQSTTSTETTSERRPSSTTPVLQSTTSHYKVLLQYYSVLQSTTPCTTPYYKVLFCTTK